MSSDASQDARRPTQRRPPCDLELRRPMLVRRTPTSSTNAIGSAALAALRPEKPALAIRFRGRRALLVLDRLASISASPTAARCSATRPRRSTGTDCRAIRGEVFARLDHLPSGVFVKGLVGGGTLIGGDIDDRDFLVDQFKFSDTTSDVQQRQPELRHDRRRLGLFAAARACVSAFFAGYHYWHEKVTAYGLVCNAATRSWAVLRSSAGTVLLDTAGAELRADLACGAHRRRTQGSDRRPLVGQRRDRRRSLCGVAEQGQPSAAAGHGAISARRRTSSPTSQYGYGVEAELFVNYAVTPNIEVGAGVRYWGLPSRNGGVTLRTDLRRQRSRSTNFDQQRYGVLLHVKGTF